MREEVVSAVQRRRISSDSDTPDDGGEQERLEREPLRSDGLAPLDALAAVRGFDEALAEPAHGVPLREDPERAVVARVRGDEVRLLGAALAEDAVRVVVDRRFDDREQLAARVQGVKSFLQCQIRRGKVTLRNPCR